MEKTSHFTDSMGYGIISWICIIALYIALKNIRKFNGDNSRKHIYLAVVPILSVSLVLYLSLSMKIQMIIDNPLAYILVGMILIHLIIKKFAFIWIQTGLLPFNKGYPTEEFSWKNAEIHKKVLYVGMMICILSLFLKSEVVFYYLFIFGLSLLVLSFSIKKKEYMIFIGSIILYGSMELDIYQVVSDSIQYSLFYFGLILIIWGFMRIRTKNKLKIRDESVDIKK